MNITVLSSKAIGAPSTAADAAIPLTVFDKANYDLHISGITFFRPPAPPNTALAVGLARALAEYREWAGRPGT